MATASSQIPDILEKLHIEPANSGACYGDWLPNPSGPELISYNPATGEPLAKIRTAGPADYECVVARASEAFLDWRMVPAPKRGEIVREIANELRAHKAELGALVSLEMGKILAEGLGEVQEMIDIADFAVGLSRQLYGLTMHSERPGHRMYEQWHPLGIVGVISAFNFPVAVWAWNAMIAAVCGDCVLWRPSSETPLAAIAVQKICNRVLDRHGLKGVFSLVIGPSKPIAESLINDRRIPLVSFTGLHRSRAARGRGGGGAAGADHSGTGREQRHHRDGRRQPRPGAARGAVRRGGNGGAALHQHAPAVSAARNRGQADGGAGAGLPAGEDRRPARRRAR